jgi:uncharacterized protein involved in outer membrane biogenesis
MYRRILLVLLFVVGILCVLYISANFIVRKTIEARFTQAIGLRTRIAGFWISPLQGTITIKNFTIANPEGFSDKPLFRLKSCSAHVILSTLSQDIIHIESLKLRGITINTEHTKDAFNLDSLKHRAAPSERHEDKSTGNSSEMKPKRKKKRFIIDTLHAKDIEVRVSSSAIGIKSIHFKVPDVVIDDFSELDEKSLTVDEIIYKLVCSIIDRLVAKGPETYQKMIRKFLMDQLNGFYKK